jgi:myb proto-oncogene protein
MVAVKLFGSGSWNKIAQFIPGRTQSQCNER